MGVDEALRTPLEANAPVKSPKPTPDPKGKGGAGAGGRGGRGGGGGGSQGGYRPTCFDYQKGRCTRGRNCRWL